MHTESGKEGKQNKNRKGEGKYRLWRVDRFFYNLRRGGVGKEVLEGTLADRKGILAGSGGGEGGEVEAGRVEGERGMLDVRVGEEGES